MGRRRLLCCSCSAGRAAIVLLALALPAAITATRLPADGAQLPLGLASDESTLSRNIWQQGSTSKTPGYAEESTAGPASYHDHAVVRIDLKHLNDAEATTLLNDIESAELDIWQKKKDQYVDVRVSPSFFDTSLYDTIKETTIITVPSVEQLLKEERAYQQLSLEALSTSSPASLVNDPNSGLHSLYHSQASITSLLELFSTDYPDFARLETIGQSAEGRDMHVLKVSDYRKRKPKSQQAEPTTWRTLSWKTLRQVWPDASLFKGKPKPKHKLGLALLGGQHAREWISPAVLLYIAHSFASTASKASLSSVHSWTDEEHEIMTLLSDYELHFIPLANPDGYVYAWDHDRLWVRSRQHIGSNETRCHGIDLNRNWGYKWERPYRPNPCSDLYPGAEAFESVENQAIKAYLEKVKSATRMDVFVDIHSFGQMIMYPYSYSCAAVPPDAENLFEALLRASKAIHSVHKQNYDVGGVCDVSYTATGQSLDWTYHDLGAKWSFAANLRDQGVYAFLLPPDQIVPTGQEMLAGLLDLARFIAQKERIED